MGPGVDQQTATDNINQDTRFVIIYDHYPQPPIQKEGAENYIYELMEQYPNCLFISSVKRPNPYDNEMWLPFYFLKTVRLNHEWQPDFKQLRPKTCNAIGGQTRISRTLLSFWLAKNYPLEQLIHHYTENNQLPALIDIVENSNYYNPKHLHPRKFLPNSFKNKFLSSEEIDIAKQFLWPNIISQSYISLLPEANGIELGARINEHSYFPLIGGNLCLPVGNYQVDKVLEDIGFDCFSDIFDLTSLSSTDRYQMTVGVLEDNKAFITDHDKVQEAWHNNINRLEHNARLARDLDHFIDHFKPVIKIASKALGDADPNHPAFSHDLMGHGPILRWLRNFTQ